MPDANAKTVLVSGGAGYIGSHVVLALQQSGFVPIVIDSLVNGHAWATQAAAHFRQGDIADIALVRELCATFKPVAVLHFAAFIEVGESVTDPQKYFANNRDKAQVFFDTLAAEGVNRIVFSSTAAVYGETSGSGLITETQPTVPINPYGQSKFEAESYLRSLAAVQSVTLRYFNVAGGAPDAGLGEAHFPETHLIPRLVLPLIGAPDELQAALGLGQGFKIYGTDFDTPDGTCIRDYIHVMDLADAHIRALRYLLDGGETNIFNLGSGDGYSVQQIVQAVRETLNRPDFQPGTAPRRAGDPARLVASSEKAQSILGWKPTRPVADMIQSAADWHGGERYVETIMAKTRQPAAAR